MRRYSIIMLVLSTVVGSLTTPASAAAPPTSRTDVTTGSVLTAPAVLSGAATSDTGIAAVQLTVQDRATRQWLHADRSFGDGPAPRLDADLGDRGRRRRPGR